jgi:IS605 OrfB family transposase
VRRACKVTLKFTTARKRRAVCALLEAYRAAVNFYIRSLWADRGSLNRETLARLSGSNTRLSARYRSQALKQALEVVTSTRKAAGARGRACSIPVFTGAAVLDAKFISIEEGSGVFDLVLRVSSLKKGKKLSLPTRRTAVLNKWAEKPGAEIIQGCALSEDSAVIWVELPEPSAKKTGASLGIDIGMNNLLALSDGSFLGDDFKEIRGRILKCRPGSSGSKKALKHRDNYIREQINKLPWDSLRMIALEDLKNLKKGKSRKRSRAFRRAAAPWVYRQVIGVILQKAQENRVHPVSVPPAYTSRTCPVCETEDARNRQAENFRCIHCGYSENADTVGSINILKKACLSVGSVESPMLPKGIQIDLSI